MRREFWLLAWRTLTSWRHSTPDPPRPGSDDQWPTFPHLPKIEPNPERQADEDDRR